MGEAINKRPYLAWVIGLQILALLLLAGCGQAQVEVVGASTPGNAKVGDATVGAAAVEPPPTPPVTPTLDPAATGTAGSATAADLTAAVSSPMETDASQGDRPTSTATRTPTATRPASPTPSPTRRPSTPTPMPGPSQTAPPPPVPSPTPSSIATVDYFRANVGQADPGQAIALEWATSNADQVTLWRLMATGQLAEFWDVAAAGSFDYQIPEHARNRVTFALAVTAGEGDDMSTQMTTLEIPLRCPDSWFFANPPDICPARAALISAGAEQHFQGGVMLWSAAEDRIYVLFAGGQDPEWNAYTDEWDPGEPESDPTLQPAAGFYQPVRGFGQVWREQPGVRDRLGWALAEEAGYQTAVQRTSYAKYNETYIRAMDGGVWRLEAERSGWGKE